jgi:hypothetical protein
MLKRRVELPEEDHSDRQKVLEIVLVHMLYHHPLDKVSTLLQNRD